MKLNMANYNLLHESLKNLTIPIDGFEDQNDTTGGVIRLPTNLDLTKESVSLCKSKVSRAH